MCIAPTMHVNRPTTVSMTGYDKTVRACVDIVCQRVSTSCEKQFAPPHF